MAQIVSLIAPIYLAIGVGYVAARFGPFTPAGVKNLSAFVINVALPCLLFAAVATRPVREVLNPTYAGAYALGSVLTLALGVMAAKAIWHKSLTAAAFFGMGASCPNSAFVGFPILIAVTPSVAGLAFGINMVVENLLVIPLVLLLAERGRGNATTVWGEITGTLARLVRNPMIVAIVVALAVSLLGIPIPGIVSRTVTLFSQAGTAVALFAVGGMLVGLSLRGVWSQMSLIVIGKLVAHPLLTAAAMLVLLRLGFPGLNPHLRDALILSAAMPTFTTYPVLAHTFGVDRVPPAALLAATALSFVTVSLLLTVLRGGI